ncbi:MAG: hypothetical protein CALGDGBN_02550 [Pseudomonadales bacterium]|nr:hypothetical protein [Pseudomonadales bacterium]
MITRRRVESWANVQVRQPVADLQDLSALEVVINVPARIVRTATPHDTALAVFDDREDAPVTLRLKSNASEADPPTQFYEIVLTLEEVPADIKVLPGMAVMVMPFVGAPSDRGQGTVDGAADRRGGGRHAYPVRVGGR